MGRVEVRLDARERSAVLRMLDTLADFRGGGPRTIPRAYDDPDLDRDYQRLTRPELEQLRDADIAAVRADLGAATRDVCRLDEDRALLWLRALNHLRLVAGGRLGIEKDGWEEDVPLADAQPDEYAMLADLGWLQDGIISAMDG